MSEPRAPAGRCGRRPLAPAREAGEVELSVKGGIFEREASLGRTGGNAAPPGCAAGGGTSLFAPPGSSSSNGCGKSKCAGA